mmetsp:Transcript_11103/g.21432  ORF Transcript_11103/g.21432 Transcript_11103/m.21432 type:complete len:680 (-) Transcript_11103:80-2119(-)
MAPKRKADQIFAGIRVFFASPEAEEASLVKLLKENGATIDKKKSWGRVAQDSSFCVCLSADLSASDNPQLKQAEDKGVPLVTAEFFTEAEKKGGVGQVDASSFHPKDAKGPAKRKATDASASSAPAAKKGKAAAAAQQPAAAPAAAAASSGGDDKEKEKNLQKAVVKGKAIVDAKFPQHSKFHVYQKGDEVWDAMLNQTNLGGNNNKYYVIQVLEPDGGGKFVVWNRWGRVGAHGQNATREYTNLEAAKGDFMEKFQDKTRNRWQGSAWKTLEAGFQTYPGKYTLLEMDYESQGGGGDDEKKKKADEKAQKEAQKKELKSKLHPKVKSIVELICDVQMMDKQMKEIGYNADKMPLGNLSKSTIKRGYEALKSIEAVLNNKSMPPSSKQQQLLDLTSTFFTVIPHNVGFANMRQFVIDSPSKLKAKLEMIEALGEIEIAQELFKGEEDLKEHPADTHFKKLNIDLSPVDNSDPAFEMVSNYLVNTHGATHTAWKTKLVNLFEVVREGEPGRFKNFSKNDNRMLLWHGSRLTNFVGILSQGLRIAPPEAPVTGYMFGKGIYFADMSSKSAQYCFPNRHSTRQLMLLCEVALGSHNELLRADYNADKAVNSGKASGMLSTKGMGKHAPDPSGTVTLPGGCKVPMGKGGPSGVNDSSLLYNEFIVYDTNQVLLKYLLEVEFVF